MSQEGQIPALIWRQLLERQAGYGGSKFLAVETQPFWKHDLLTLLFLVEAEFHPEPRSVRQEMLGEGQRALHIELILGRAT